MKSDNKKSLYESIMTSVAKEVKKALNEDNNQNFDAEYVATIKKLYEYNRAAFKLLSQYGKFVEYGVNDEGYYLNDDNLQHLLLNNISNAYKYLRDNAKALREKAEKMNIDLGIKK